MGFETNFLCSYSDNSCKETTNLFEEMSPDSKLLQVWS